MSPQKEGYIYPPLTHNTHRFFMGPELWRETGLVAYEQQRCRRACTAVQSCQHLCFSLSRKLNIQNSYMQNFNILAALSAGLNQPDDTFSHVASKVVYLHAGTYTDSYSDRINHCLVVVYQLSPSSPYQHHLQWPLDKMAANYHCDNLFFNAQIRYLR